MRNANNGLPLEPLKFIPEPDVEVLETDFGWLLWDVCTKELDRLTADGRAQQLAEMA